MSWAEAKWIKDQTANDIYTSEDNILKVLSGKGLRASDNVVETYVGSAKTYSSQVNLIGTFTAPATGTVKIKTSYKQSEDLYETYQINLVVTKNEVTNYSLALADCVAFQNHRITVYNTYFENSLLVSVTEGETYNIYITGETCSKHTYNSITLCYDSGYHYKGLTSGGTFGRLALNPGTSKTITLLNLKGSGVIECYVHGLWSDVAINFNVETDGTTLNGSVSAGALGLCMNSNQPASYPRGVYFQGITSSSEVLGMGVYTPIRIPFNNHIKVYFKTSSSSGYTSINANYLINYIVSE